MLHNCRLGKSPGCVFATGDSESCGGAGGIDDSGNAPAYGPALFPVYEMRQDVPAAETQLFLEVPAEATTRSP